MDCESESVKIDGSPIEFAGPSTTGSREKAASS